MKRNKLAEKKLKDELIKRFGLVDMFTGKYCLFPTLHHIDHNCSNNSFENGSLIAKDTQYVVHKYQASDIRYWEYANKIRQYKATH